MGVSKNWLLLTKEADFSYLSKALGVFHTVKASWALSHDVYKAGSLKPPATSKEAIQLFPNLLQVTEKNWAVKETSKKKKFLLHSPLPLPALQLLLLT